MRRRQPTRPPPLRLPLRTLFAAALALAGCDDRPRTWTAYVYPDIENMDRVIKTDGFKDFESCQLAAITALRSQDRPEAGDYVCGYRCGFKAEYGMEICKDKRK